MSFENLVSVQFTEEDKTTVRDCIQSLRVTFDKYLIALSADKVKKLPKMSDKTVPFADKVLVYMESNPEFSPAYINLDEMKIDMAAFKLLNEFFTGLDQIVSKLQDTMILSGSEVYSGALAYYSSSKEATKRDVPNAKPIYEDLAQRFAGRPKETVEA